MRAPKATLIDIPTETNGEPTTEWPVKNYDEVLENVVDDTAEPVDLVAPITLQPVEINSVVDEVAQS